MSLLPHADEPLALVAGLWRYPVKGMRGESVEELDMDESGIAGDRRYAFESEGAPAGKPMLTGRERAAMLLYRASTRDGQVVVATPDHAVFAVDDPELVRSMQADLPQAHRLVLRHAPEPFTDCRPVALLSLQALAALSAEFGSPVDARRFRANLVLHFPGYAGETTLCPEDGLVGRRVRIGEAAELHITERDPRCRIVTLDPETATPDPALMKLLDRTRNGKLGVYAAPTASGRIHVGDPVFLVSA